MKSFKIPIIVFSIFLIFYSCKNNSDSGTDPVYDPISILSKTSWILIQNSHLGYTHLVDSTSAHIFTFFKDGKFVEDYVSGCCKNEGEWKINNDYSVLYLTNSTNDRSYKIYSLSMNELVLGWQGREGMVIEKYKPIK
jgi:hypothetical protein